MLDCHAAREAIQETCRVLIAGASGVYHAVYWLGLNVHQIVAIDDNRTALVAGDSPKLAVASQLLERLFIRSLIQRLQFELVAEQHVDIVQNEIEKVFTMPIYAERVGQGK